MQASTRGPEETARVARRGPIRGHVPPSVGVDGRAKAYTVQSQDPERAQVGFPMTTAGTHLGRVGRAC